MRRPPEVVQVGFLVVSLLGASGCAGFSQRSGATSLWGVPSDGEPAPPPGVFSWLHRGASQNSAAPSDGAGSADTSRPSAAPVVAARPFTDPWPESQSEWFARNFPRMNRLWNGSTTGNTRDGGDLTGRLQTSRTPANSRATDSPVTASTPRADLEVRPTDGTSQDAPASNAPRSGSRARYPGDLPYSPASPPATSPRQSTIEPASNPALDVTTPAAASQVSNQSEKADQAEPASDQEDDDSASTERSPAAPSGPSSSPDPAVAEARTFDDILPAPTGAGPQPALSVGGGTAAATEATSGAADAAGSASDRAPAPTLESGLAQVVPPPPPVQRTPPPPAPPGSEQPPSSPPNPPAAEPAAGASPPATTNAAPAATAPAPTVGSAAAPAAAQGQAPVAGSFQRPTAASGQSIYASPPPMAPAQPRHHLLGWLFHDEPTVPLASPQLPVAAFPASYPAPQNVQSTGHGTAAACESPATTPKKPCFLKVWIHDLKCARGKCSHGGGCGHSGDLASAQGGVSASPQGQPAECGATTKAPKKPCFLKVWIHDWKNGHGSCGSCQQGGSGCQTCKCCGGGGTPVSASPQGGTASGQSGATAGAVKH